MYDVIVIGAGPAGATAARYCALNNLKTLLLEKEKIPRYKPCAGGVTLAAVKELDFELPAALIERQCCGMRTSFGRHQQQIIKDHTIAYMVTRSKFDEYLVEKALEAGAEVQDTETCISVLSSQKSVDVRTNKKVYQANIVIGADGYFSKVLKSIRSGFDQDEIRFCVIADIPMPESEISSRLSDCVELHYGLIDVGYAWFFPKKNYISAGIGSLSTRSKTLVNTFKEFLRMKGLDEKVEPHRCFIPISNFRHNIYTDRIMLAGDAAGFVDAFSGEGIRYAIKSGRAAAKTAVYSFEKKRFSADVLKIYQETCTNEFSQDLLYSHRLTEWIFSRPSLFLLTALVDEGVQKKYIETITGMTGLKDFVVWVKKRFPYFLLKRFFRLKI